MLRLLYLLSFLSFNTCVISGVFSSLRAGAEGHYTWVEEVIDTDIATMRVSTIFISQPQERLQKRALFSNLTSGGELRERDSLGTGISSIKFPK